VFEEGDEKYVSLQLDCGHVKSCKIKSVLKWKPKCSVCNPPKECNKQEPKPLEEHAEYIFERHNDVVCKITGFYVKVTCDKT